MYQYNNNSNNSNNNNDTKPNGKGLTTKRMTKSNTKPSSAVGARTANQCNTRVPRAGTEFRRLSGRKQYSEPNAINSEDNCK